MAQTLNISVDKSQEEGQNITKSIYAYALW